MTHDELLAKIGTMITIEAKINENDAETLIATARKLSALRAVVELHKPDPDSCHCCGPVLDVCGVEYPCPTIQAIEKELF